MLDKQLNMTITITAERASVLKYLLSFLSELDLKPGDSDSCDVINGYVSYDVKEVNITTEADRVKPRDSKCQE